ncbi:uncharacterized protein LOC129766805 [Toxorhynchites rutilus septentrionalis]|uniref:uncharacterized protein LOC129766805 n=1 Tax=Toxorhynchites rutilus septentrionalis TaxID=329112 RepID=UPI00247A394B|nr:uncharacterized protein LOC129766805 [Toxorhynchites rutilus septentrionalis]
MVIYLLTSALDKATRKQWEQTMKPGELPNYNLTISFLKSQCQVLERCENAHYPSYPKKTITTTKGVSHRSYAATSIQEPPTAKCDFCSEQHRNFQCNKLNAMSASEKIEKVCSAGVCFNCLRKGHRSKECPSPRSCRKCQRRHHTQLHEDEVTSNVNYNSKSETCTLKITLVDEDLTTKQSNETNVLSTCSCNHARTTKTVLLLTAVVLVMDKDKQPHQCRVLLDSGSQVNFLTERMANILGIPKQRASVQISGINNLRTIARDKVEVDFQSRCSEYRARLECLVTPEITGKIPSVLVNVEEWNIPTNIMLADPNFFKPEQIDMLIGMELFFNLLKPDHITNDENIPDLRDSHLGWLVTGTVSSNVNTLYSQVASVESIEESMQKFWQVEELADTTTFSSKEQRCEEHFVSTHSRDVSGRFVVRLPLKENAAELESCRALALKRFFMLESRFLRNPELKMQYVDFIREYRLLNHCRQVDESKDNPLLKSYYMPHHAVLRPDNSSTKCRVVFDASAKPSPTSVSLNDALLVGPVVQNELFAIMLRFRKHRYVFTADISKMYRQIQVHPDDARYQRIFWRENSTDCLQVLELTTITYGTASAPFQATRSLVQLARDEREKFTVAADIILKDTYVDDLLSGSETIEGAIDAFHQLKAMLETAGFPIHKWCSNSSIMLGQIPLGEQETPKPIEERKVNNAVKILGLLWEPTSDEFLLAGKMTSDFRPPATKRKIYSEVAKLFDPLGLFSPTIVQAKLLVQQLWRHNLDWDEPINDEMSERWNELRQGLPQLMEIKIPRQVTFSEAACYEIHGFADASNAAYGACLYIRSLYPGGLAKSRLLCSKSKVAPLHALTIPRKELCAALLLSRLVKKVIAVLDIDIKRVILWSDSQIVLAWLRKHSDRLEIFVRNRVAEILNNTDEFKWSYVRSEENPADVVSRGQAPIMLMKNELWWNGPQFLAQPIIETEPTLEIPDDDLPELKSICPIISAAIIEQQLPVFRKYSCFRKLQRVIAWMLRFKNNARRNGERILSTHLTVKELRQSMLVIVRVIQQVELADEINRLESQQQCKRLSSLNPFYIEGVLRVGGRLKHSKLPEISKHQIILPNTVKRANRKGSWVDREDNRQGVIESPQVEAASFKTYPEPTGAVGGGTPEPDCDLNQRPHRACEERLGRNDYGGEVLPTNRRNTPEAPTYVPEIGKYEGANFPPRQRPAHVAHPTLQKLNELGYETLPHPAYSPDLSPTDYHFFKRLDNFLREKCFKNQDNAKNAFNAFVASKELDFYSSGINKLISRWQKCVDCNGSYFD